MAQNSKIEWTDHTFNPWIGCMKVSAGCKHCYAESLNHRWGHDNWGPATTTRRRVTSVAYWRQPLLWNKRAQEAGRRAKVFCASMADVFEDHPDVAAVRPRLFDLIAETPHLDWLLLTKRPENIKPMLIAAGRGFQDLPPHVWIGTSVEDQEQANQRIPHLLRVPAPVRFLSCEPLLGPVDLTKLLVSTPCWHCGHLDGETGRCVCGVPIESEIHWVIVGGESGAHARPMRPEWARSLRDQCQASGVAFFFKQWGEWLPFAGGLIDGNYGSIRVGKHAAGRLLDDQEWNEVPA